MIYVYISRKQVVSRETESGFWVGSAWPSWVQAWLFLSSLIGAGPIAPPEAQRVKEANSDPWRPRKSMLDPESNGFGSQASEILDSWTLGAIVFGLAEICCVNCHQCFTCRVGHGHGVWGIVILLLQSLGALVENSHQKCAWGCLGLGNLVL